jgi:hypothetical protein
MTTESAAHTTASTWERQSPSASACRAAASNLPEAGVCPAEGRLSSWNSGVS